jgi:hypothetical protein
VIGTNDTDGTTNTRIIISGNTRTSVAGNIEYVATSTGKHIFYSAGATEIMRITDTGNVGIGTNNPLALLDLVKPTASGVATDIINMRLNADWGLKLQQYYTGTGNIQYDFIHRYNATNYNSLTFKGANVGLGSTTPAYRCHIRCSYSDASQSLHLDANDTGNVNQYALTIYAFVIGGGEVGWRFRTQSNTGGTNTPLTLNNYGNVAVQNALNIGGDKYVGGTSYMRNTYIYSGGEGSSIGLYFSTPFYGTPTSANKSAIIAEAKSSYSRHDLVFCVNGTASNSENVSTANVFMRLNYTGYVQVYKPFIVYNEVYGGFYSVSMTNTDYLCVQGDYGGNGAYGERWMKVAFGSFTAFHRCYTDDELYNNETDENIDIFKNNFMGRVVIATGKIKTDFTRTTQLPKEPDEPDDPNEPANKPPKENNEWYSEIDKDGITIEDAVPIVRLSRQRKDKRVFGVFGGAKRSTNNKNRLIVNSIGEGAICVSNTNGNIENGDFIQSSDLLGYGEKQDDDLLHNYTIAKATIDCNFELDNPYYQCREIENGVRVAFIACSYHCG